VLPAEEPGHDLWPGIASAIGAHPAQALAPAAAPDVRPLPRRPAARRVTFSIPQLAAASIVLVLGSVLVGRYFLRSEPANAAGTSSRFFAPDLNGRVYILDKATKSFDSTPGGAVDPYLDFASIFGSAFDASPGFAAGVVTLQFDPEYALVGSPNFGKFYTTHTEINAALDPNEYRQAVLTGWQDTNPNDTTFSGTRREMMRTTYQNNIHPIGDIVFNPNAGPGHPDAGGAPGMVARAR
jgi:hypothetical protein